MLNLTVRWVLVAVTAVVCLALGPTQAQAQIGSGWTPYSPPESLQVRGCAAHNGAGGVDQFRITCGDMSGDNRAEHRTMNDYSSGTNQFEGEIRVVSIGTNIIVKQTFMPNRGAFFMMAVSADGRLYLHGGGGDVLPNVVGRWVRINTIHDVNAGTHQVYADGILRTTKSGGAQVAWHDKYGAYRSQSGRGPAVVEWRNIKYWRGGRATGGANPPPPPRDAGAPDRGGDSAVAVDGSSGAGGSSGGAGGSSGGAGGGSGGAGGTGGSGTGAGGATATGGTSGGGGAPGTVSPPAGSGGRAGGAGGRSGGGARPDAGGASMPSSPSSGGCALGAPTSPSPAWVLVGILMVALARRRRPDR